MKKVVIALVLTLSALMTGCGKPDAGTCPLVGYCPTLVDTGPERNRRIALEYSLQMKMLVEDWDSLWLQERASRLTQWHPYVGY